MVEGVNRLPWISFIRALILLIRALPSWPDRKSTRLNSSHLVISYAVFCLKKKNLNNRHTVISYALCCSKKNKKRVRAVVDELITYKCHSGFHHFLQDGGQC